jgi:hypothetical protein
MQLAQERIVNAAMDLLASTCVLSGWDAEWQAAGRYGDAAPSELKAADLFLRQSFRRIRGFLDGLSHSDGRAVLAKADSVLGSCAAYAAVAPYQRSAADP